jgi:hypothetical protein
MSIDQIKEEVRRLSPRDLVQFTEWLENYLTSKQDWPETSEHLAQLEARLADFKANPQMFEPFEPDYFENLKKQLLR